MQIVATDNAPQAIGPYSQAMIHNGLLYSSGQIALRPDGSMNEGSITEQTHQVLTNLSAVLKEGGSSLDKVIKTTIFLSDMANFEAVNEVYASYFGEHKPARSTIAVRQLPKNALVEIECIAVV